MTIGIYKLVFKDTDKVYIGQSLNIEKRFSTHRYCLSNNAHSKKLMQAYETYGMPSLVILSECSKEELLVQEAECIDIYNSIHNGFNYSTTSSGGGALQGSDNPKSLYSNETVYNVMHYLVTKPELTQRQIAEELQVGLSFVEHISAGNTGAWLQEDHPEEYNKLMSMKNTRDTREKLSIAGSAKSRGIVYPRIVDPQGNKYTVDNVRKFGREHNLNNGDLCQVLNRRKATVKGWYIEK